MPDPISLKSFTDIRTDRQVGMGDDGQLKDTGSRKVFLGRLVQAIGRTDVQREENKRATESFVQALTRSYGERIGEWAQRELQGHLEQGKPLTGRRIQEIVEGAKGQLGGEQREQALEYAQARKDDVMQGYIRNRDGEGKSPEDAEAKMFPQGWEERFLQRFEVHTASGMGVDDARKQAFDDVIVRTSHQVFHKEETNDLVERARTSFLNPNSPSTEVQGRLKDFYEKQFLPLEQEVAKLTPGRQDLPRLLDLPMKIAQLNERYTELRNEMKRDGLPELKGFSMHVDRLVEHLSDTLLTRMQMKSDKDSGDLMKTLTSMGKLAQEAQDPLKREEMFRDPGVREQMNRLDLELEQARIKRPPNEAFNNGVNFLQDIVRQTANLCSQAQGESNLTQDVPPFLKQAVVTYGPNHAPETTMGWSTLVGDNPKVKEGVELLDKLEAMVQSPGTPIQLRLDGAFHAEQLRNRIGGLVGEKLGGGVTPQPFNAFLGTFAPPPQGEQLQRLNQCLGEMARCRQLLDSGGEIPKDQGDGVRRSLDDLRRFLEPHMSGTTTPAREARWLEALTRAIERRIQ